MPRRFWKWFYLGKRVNPLVIFTQKIFLKPLSFEIRLLENIVYEKGNDVVIHFFGGNSNPRAC